MPSCSPGRWRGANHPLWQLGHICGGEVKMVNAIKPGVMPELPAEFAQRFDHKMASVDDPKHFIATKQELIDLFTKIRAGRRSRSSRRFRQRIWTRRHRKFLRRVAPTVGEVLMLLVGHVAMHAGQIQVARCKLGKPILF